MLLKEEQNGVLRFGGSRMALLNIEAGFWSLRRQIEALIGERLTNLVLQQAGVNGGASFAHSFIELIVDDEPALFAAWLEAYQAAGFGQFEITSLEWPPGRIQIEATNSFEAWMYQQHNNVPDTPICSYSAGVLVGFANTLSQRQDVVCIEHTCQARGDAVCSFELKPASEAKGQTAVSFTPDPGLGRQLNLLEILFERMPMGIAVLDPEYRVQRYNQTWDDFSARYAPPSGAPLTPGIRYFDHIPHTEAAIKPLFDRALAGETVRQNNVRLESEGIVTFWDVVLAPLVEGDDVAGILVVSIDVSEKVRLRQDLEARVSARTQELQMLLTVAATANSALDLEEMLIKTLDLLVELVKAFRVGVGLIDEKSEEWQSTILRPEQDVDAAEMAIMLQAGQAVARSGEMMYIAPDTAEGLLEPGVLLPLQIRERKLGVLVIIGPEGSAFTQDQLELFKAIADQVSIAVENAYLFEKVEDSAIAAERNRLARELHDAVTQTIFSASLIADVLPRLWENNPEEGRRRLDELRELTRGALAEMRALLMELRPSTLTAFGLADLLRQLAEATIGRSRLPVALNIEGERPLPPEVKVAFYRIAQESLHNISKHAGADAVQMQLHYASTAVELTIQDNGRGFNVADISPGSMGVGIMQERAAKIGAAFQIDSQIGEGTAVSIRWSYEDKYDE